MVVEGDGVPIVGVGARVLDRCSVSSEFVVPLAEQPGQLPSMTDGDVSPCRRQPVLASSQEREFTGSHIPAGHLPVEAFDIGGGQRENFGGHRSDRHVIVRVPEPRLDAIRPGELDETDAVISRIRDPPEVDEGTDGHEQGENSQLDADRYDGSAPPPVAAEERSDPEEGDHDGDIAPDPVGFPLRSQTSRLSGGIVLFGFLSGRSPLERREVEITCFHRKTLTTSRLPERSALR